MSKEARKDMHKAIREHFPGLESRTEDSDNGDKKMIVQRGNTGNGGTLMQWTVGSCSLYTSLDSRLH